MRVKVGLVGYGYWGPKIASAVKKVHEAELFAIADQSPKSREQIRSAFSDGVHNIYEDFQDLINDPDVVAVIIATPPDTHEMFTELALLAGKHVLVEKPIFLEEAKGQSLVSLAQKSSLILMPGHTFLYNDAIVWAKQFIDAGGIGIPLTAYSSRLNLGQLRKDTNVIWSLAPHDVSIFNFLFGSSPVAVSASGSAVVQPNILDFAHINLFYPNNLIAHIHVSWLDPGKIREVTIVGSEGMLTINDVARNKLKVHEKFAKPTSNSFDSKEKVGRSDDYTLIDSGKIYEPILNYREPLVVEIENFIKSILGLAPQVATSEDGLVIARVLTAAETSISESGRQISLTS
jgi:predicted dehydrogenase